MPISYMFPGADQLDDQTRRALMGQSAVAMGAQMLQAGGQGKSTAEALGMGLQSGLGSLTRSQQVAMENAMRRQQMERAQAQEDREQEKFESWQDRLERQQQFWHSMDPKGKESAQGTSPGAPTPGSMTPQGIVPQMQQGQFQPSMETGVRALAAGVDPSTAQFLMPNMGKPASNDLVKVRVDGEDRWVPKSMAAGLPAPNNSWPFKVGTPNYMGQYPMWDREGNLQFVGGGPQSQPPAPGGATPPTGGGSVMGDVETGTGIVSNLQSAWNNTWGQLVQGTPFPDVERARQGLRFFNQDMKQALINSQRYPVYEQRVLEEMQVKPGDLGDPDAAREKMLRLKADLEQKHATNQSQLVRGGLTEDTFEKLKSQNQAIENTLSKMQIPQQGTGLRPGVSVDGYRYKGGDPNDPNSWEEVQ